MLKTIIFAQTEGRFGGNGFDFFLLMYVTLLVDRSTIAIENELINVFDLLEA